MIFINMCLILFSNILCKVIFDVICNLFLILYFVYLILIILCEDNVLELFLFCKNKWLLVRYKCIM